MIPVTGLTAIDVDKERIKLETQRLFIGDQKVRLPGIRASDAPGNKNLRKYKVRDCDSEDFLEVFRGIPVWKASQDRPAIIIYGSRDMPEIITVCDAVKDVPVIKIEQALHGDIIINEATYEKIACQLQQWFR